MAATAALPPIRPKLPLLHPSATIPVAFVISDGAVVIDVGGPWEVFGQVMVPGHHQHPFQLYTVSDKQRRSPLAAD